MALIVAIAAPKPVESATLSVVCASDARGATMMNAVAVATTATLSRSLLPNSIHFNVTEFQSQPTVPGQDEIRSLKNQVTTL